MGASCCVVRVTVFFRLVRVTVPSGGGYTGGSSRIQNDEDCDGGGGGSFAADPDASFDNQFEEFGKCKIKFLN